MEHIFPIITRLLDNVIDLNAYPVEETRISAEKYRAI
jgi:ribonucleotide reductase alpha subunit